MAVDQVSARSVQALNSSGTQDAAGLREGTQLEGRVLAVNPDDSLRVATRYGLLDVDPSQISVGGGHGRGKLPPLADLIGTMVKLEITGQTATSGRYMVKLISSGDAAASPIAELGLPAPEAEAAARIAAEVSQAAARQDGLGPVFAGVRQLAAAPGILPGNVSNALNNLTNLALNGADQISAGDIRNAVSASGLFLEAKLARWAVGANDGDSGFHLDPTVSLASQDIKAALFGLKSALDGWIAEASAASPQDANVSASAADEPSTAAAILTSQSAIEAAASDLEAAAVFDTEALFAVLRPPPVVTSANPPAAMPFAQLGAGVIGAGLAAQGAAAQFAGRPDLVTMATLGEWLQAAGQAPVANTARRTAYGGRPIVSDGSKRETPTNDGVASARPPPPRRGSLPQGQAAVLSTTSATKQPVDIARELVIKTGDALARVSLGQYASLPDRQTAASLASSAPPAASQATAQTKAPASWLFEIPLRIGDSTSIAQFEIDQVFDGAPSTAEDGRAWRVQFSLDIAPIGPIHARLVLADRRLSVGLWAEDRIGAAALQSGIFSLRRSLEAADFVIDEIHFASGRPPSGPPVQAGGFIDRNA